MTTAPLLLLMGQPMKLTIERRGGRVAVVFDETGTRIELTPREADGLAGHLTAVATQIISEAKKS